MKIEITRLENKGDQNEEKVWLKVKEDCNLDFYVLCDTTYTSDNQISNKLRNSFWFPKKQVHAGDFIVLYTKEGKQTDWKNKADTTTHAFYWGLKRAVWNNEGDCAVLFETKGWTTKK